MADRTRRERRPLRVLRIINVRGDVNGGAALQIKTSTESLRKRGHAVDTWFSEDLVAAEMSPRLRRLLVPWVVAGRVTLAALNRRYDVVEVHEPIGGPVCAVARIWCRRFPRVVVLSHGLEERGWQAECDLARALGRSVSLKRTLGQLVMVRAPAWVSLRLASCSMVLSLEDMRYLRERRPAATEHVFYVRNGVDAERFVPVPPPSQGANGGLDVVFLGSWVDRKGTVQLARAFDDPNVQERCRLHVLGAGVAEDDVLEAFTPEARSRVTVRSTLSRQEMSTALSGYDTLILPSWFEGMPLAMLEGAASGLCVVVSRRCGMRDFLGDEPDVNGGLYVDLDAESIAAALLALADNPERVAVLGARARARAAEFTWERCSVDLESAYRHALRGAC